MIFATLVRTSVLDSCQPETTLERYNCAACAQIRVDVMEAEELGCRLNGIHWSKDDGEAEVGRLCSLMMPTVKSLAMEEARLTSSMMERLLVWLC